MNLNFKVMGEGEPLLILHGLFGSLDNWISLGRRYGTFRKTYLIDQRNHGKSPHTEQHGYPEMAEDLLTFMDQQEISSAAWLGHSMGGKTVMEAALQAPDRCSALIVADMAPVVYRRHHDEIITALEAVPLNEIQNRAEAEAILTPLLPDVGVRQFLLKNLDRTTEGKYVWKMNLPVLKKEYDFIVKEIPRERKYSGPTLFIKGGNSNYIKDAYLPEMQELFPNMELITLPGIGHWVHAEAPDDFFQITSNFLKGI
ncbi:MAG: alpha/beta fold hydrolase [Sphingobacteriia bacterium]|nr:alpha/beta fold hydrolase [Sphingobacteriia bacterium]